MKKTALKVVGQDDSYKLTRQEYTKLCDAFYEAQSLIRIITKVETKDTDVSNLCDIAMEKFRVIEPLLGK